jgi:hypothetical protein
MIQLSRRLRRFERIEGDHQGGQGKRIDNKSTLYSHLMQKITDRGTSSDKGRIWDKEAKTIAPSKVSIHRLRGYRG